jgi:hypothetical protein
MPSIKTTFSIRQLPLAVLAAALICVFVQPGKIHAQRNPPTAVAQVGAGSPLPVYVVNDLPPQLPDGFVPGSSWKFTTWTVPSTLTFTAAVKQVEGGWALLTLNTDQPAASRWYYIPLMPGAWEVQ